MKSYDDRGFTLIELMIVLIIMILLLFAAAPLIAGWAYSAQVHDARAKLAQGFGLTKAFALRNPNASTLPNAAAGLLISTNGNTTTLLACAGSASNSACTVSGALWSATYPGAISTVVNGTTVTAAVPVGIDIDNRGEAMASGATTLLSAASYSVSRGNSSESGSFY